MRHVSRTHLVALDWLLDRINLDAKIQLKFVESKNPIADILAKSSFTRDSTICDNFLNIMNDTTFSCSHFSNSHPLISAGKQSEMSKRSQESTSLGSPTAKANACCLVSRHGVSVDTLKRAPAKKDVQTLDVVLFSMLRESESMAQKTPEVSQKRKPQESESTREKSFKIWKTDSDTMIASRKYRSTLIRCTFRY